MAHGHKSYDRPSPEGMLAVRGVAVVDKIPQDECPTCKAKVHLDSDGRGHLREWLSGPFGCVGVARTLCRCYYRCTEQHQP